MSDDRSIEWQRAEFDAADEFAKQVQRHNQTAVVDDDYPMVRHEYEGALAVLIAAMKRNGRFIPGNRYNLIDPKDYKQL